MLRSSILFVLALALPGLAHAATYDVGPGQTYTTLGAVPWPTLAAGDTVRIHPEGSPYHEKFIVNASGTASAPILITGVPDSSGNLPVLDGDSAVEAPNEQGYQDDDRFIIKIGDASTPSNPNGGAYISIEKLHIKNAYPTYTFSSNRLGSGVNYAQNAAAIWLQHGDHLTIRGCEIEHNADGIFGAYGASNPVSNVLIEGNWLHDNGVDGDAYEHNSYVQVDGVVYQFNHYGPPLSTSSANNLKDRSSKMVARYNWLEGGERVMDLVDNNNFTGDPSYFTAFVYGNVIIKTSSAGNNAIIHFGGDSGTTANYRTTLWLWNNTIVSARSGNCTLLQLDTASQTVNLLNDIVTAQAGSTIPSLGGTGTVNQDHDWIASGSTIDPGFVDLANADFHLASGAAVINAGNALPADLASYPLDTQYVVHQGSEPRPQDGAIDIGAFEFGTVSTTSSSSGSTSTSGSSGSTGTTTSSSSSSGTATTSATSTSSSTAAGSTSSSSSSSGSTSGASASSSGATGGASAGASSGSTGSAGTAKGGCGSVGGGELALLAMLLCGAGLGRKAHRR